MAISKKDVEKARSRVDESTKDLDGVKANEFVRKSITIDEKTLSKIKGFQERKGLDFSSALRFIVNDYFEKV